MQFSTKRISIKENDNEIVLRLNPSRNKLVLAFHLLALIPVSYFLIHGLRSSIQTFSSEFEMADILFNAFYNFMAIAFLLKSLVNIYHFLYAEEQLIINSQTTTIIKKGIFKRKVLEFKTQEIKALEIENETQLKKNKLPLEFGRWTNFKLITEKRKVRFFEMTAYEDLEVVVRFLKAKEII